MSLSFKQWITSGLYLYSEGVVSREQLTQRALRRSSEFDSESIFEAFLEISHTVSSVASRFAAAQLVHGLVKDRKPPHEEHKMVTVWLVDAACDYLQDRHDPWVFHSAASAIEELHRAALLGQSEADLAVSHVLTGRLYLAPLLPDPIFNSADGSRILRMGNAIWTREGSYDPDEIVRGKNPDPEYRPFPTRGDLLMGAVSSLREAEKIATGTWMLHVRALSACADDLEWTRKIKDGSVLGKGPNPEFKIFLERVRDLANEARKALLPSVEWRMLYILFSYLPEGSGRRTPLDPLSGKEEFPVSVHDKINNLIFSALVKSATGRGQDAELEIIEGLLPPLSVTGFYRDARFEGAWLWLKTRRAHSLGKQVVSCGRASELKSVSDIEALGKQVSWAPYQMAHAAIHAVCHDVSAVGYLDKEEMRRLVVEGSPASLSFFDAQLVMSENSTQTDIDEQSLENMLYRALGFMRSDSYEAAGVNLLHAYQVAADNGVDIDSSGSAILSLLDFIIEHYAYALPHDAVQACLWLLHRILFIAWKEKSEDLGTISLQVHQISKSHSFSKILAAQPATPFASDGVYESHASTFRQMVAEIDGWTAGEESNEMEAASYDLSGLYGPAAFWSPAGRLSGRSRTQLLSNARRRYQHDVLLAEQAALMGIPTAPSIRPSDFDSLLGSGEAVLSILNCEVLGEGAPGSCTFMHVAIRGQQLVIFREDEDRRPLRAQVGSRLESDEGITEFSILNEEVFNLRNCLIEPVEFHCITGEGEEALSYLRSFFEPVTAWLGEIFPSTDLLAHLMVWPHGAFHYFPWPLIAGIRERFIGRECLVTVVPSLQSLAQRTTPLLQRAKLLSIASSDGGVERGLSAEPTLEMTAKKIAAMFGTSAFTGNRAVVSAFMENAPKSAYIHVAAHGVQDFAAPLFQAILLCPNKGNESVLYADHIRSLDLKGVSLVTLSACDSLLLLFDDQDNLLGLGKAFLVAGAKVVIGALWPISAGVASFFFSSLYEDLAQTGKPEVSFRKAQHATMDAFPRYGDWAAFCFAGSPGARSVDRSL